MTDDVVAELDRWLEGGPGLLSPWTVKRARDEIVALRETVERQRLVLSKGHAETRAAALEEAARICDLDDCVRIKASALATDIRALKGKP